MKELVEAHPDKFEWSSSLKAGASQRCYGYKTNQLTKIKKEFENTELGEDEMLRQALILLAKRNGV